MRSPLQVAMPVLVPPAVVIWIMIRLIVAALPVTAGEAPGSIPPPPVAVVLLCGLAGLIDVRVRGERLLWANLGVPAAALYAAYAAAAIPGELLVALVLR